MPSGEEGVTANLSTAKPHITATVKDVRCTTITGARNETSWKTAPISTNAASPRVAMRVAITVP